VDKAEAFAALLPSCAALECATDDSGPDDAFPEERALIADAIPARRAEFTTTRRCARRALARLGVPEAPILRGARRQPTWPVGVVGSLTHCAGLRAAAVARADRCAALGIDAEVCAPLSAGVAALVLTAAERAAAADLARRDPAIGWETVLFSAKESVYKAWFPLTGAWLGFQDCEVDLDPLSGGFVARLLVAGPVFAGRPLTRFAGRWAVAGEHALTAVALPAVGPA
jgi:4'-phosphopantetheinyl transferase EntD